MGILTRGGVCYDLSESPFIHEMEYSGNTVKYVFSSEKNKSRFIERYQEKREEISKSLTNRFGIKVGLDLVADLKCYENNESRGFYIVINGKVAQCLNNIKLDGEIKMSVY